MKNFNLYIDIFTIFLAKKIVHINKRHLYDGTSKKIIATNMR